MADIF